MNSLKSWKTNWNEYPFRNILGRILNIWKKYSLKIWNILWLSEINSNHISWNTNDILSCDLNRLVSLEYSLIFQSLFHSNEKRKEFTHYFIKILSDILNQINLLKINSGFSPDIL